MEVQKKVLNREGMLNRILMRAWRERWTEFQWGINIKAALPRGVSGEAYNLTEVILQQAIGVGANKLLLSYLKHSLCSHLITYAAVLKRLSKYHSFEKYHCINTLLDFLISIINGVTCRSKPEESVLINAVLSLVYWLMEMCDKILIRVVELNETLSMEQEQCLEKVSVLINQIVKNPFLMGVLYVSKYEDPELFHKCEVQYEKLCWFSGKCNQLGVQVDSIGKIIKDFYQIVFVKIDDLKMKEFESKSPESITYCLQPLLAVEVLLNPSADSQSYVTKLLMIMRLKNYSRSRLYCEIIRACLISLSNVSGSSYSAWCAFTLIKVPDILKKLHRQSKSYDDKLDYSEDIVKAFELLLENSPILDLLDTKCNCNALESILIELKKQNLINDELSKKLLDKREPMLAGVDKLDIVTAQPSFPKFVMIIEPPLTGILKTLSHLDCNKKPELLHLLATLLAGNSLELISTVAVVDGRLKTFIGGLIRCNEQTKQVTGEVGKAAVARSTLFDISFLMLFYIVQKYGSDVVLEENGDSFFEKWVRECMFERNKPKSPMTIVKNCDQSKVDELIGYFSDTNVQHPKTISLKWHEICMNLPAMLYGVLMAWENETIPPASVKTILDNMRMKLCCFSVTSASWLCSYMKIIRENELAKPKTMLQILTLPPSDDGQIKQETLNERLGLTITIIQKLHYDVQPAVSTTTVTSLIENNKLVSKDPLNDLFNEQWREISIRNWLPIDSTQTLRSLFQSCGPLWIMNNLVEQIFQCKYVQDMQQTTDIVFAIMHLNIESCTMALLNEILPIMLLNKTQNCKLVEPQSRLLAKLCVYAILSSMEAPVSVSQTKKRSRDGDEVDNLSPLTKMRKINQDGSVGMGAECENGEKDNTSPIKESLQLCLQNLFKMFHQQVIATDELSTKVYFIFQFLSLLVQCGNTERIKQILKLIPNGLLVNLLKIIPYEELTFGFILRLYDCSSYGRISSISDLCLLKNIQIRRNSIQL